MRRMVVVSFRFEGFHCWPGAPEVHGYLSNVHRHEFHVKAWKAVAHNNREVEIIALKRMMQAYCNDGNLGSASCEDFAQELIEQFGLVACEVLEDGENGAYLEAE